jgi:hypothetical protein
VVQPQNVQNVKKTVFFMEWQFWDFIFFNCFKLLCHCGVTRYENVQVRSVQSKTEIEFECYLIIEMLCFCNSSSVRCPKLFPVSIFGEGVALYVNF